MKFAPIIGIDIGGTKSALSRLRPDGTVQELARFATGAPKETLEALAAVMEKHQPGRNPIFGIACGSPQDSRRGIILAPPNLPGWNRVGITRFFTTRFGGKAFLLNDAKANALAEWHFGAGRGCRSFVFLTAGTGLGAGLILNGELHQGACGDAGEIGHVRLAETGPVGFRKAGSCEGFCSGGGIAQLIDFVPAGLKARRRQAWKAAHPTLSEIALAARRGDRIALAIFNEAGRRWGQALALIIDLLNPDCIALGTVWQHCRGLLGPEVRRVLRSEALGPSRRACRIVPSALGEALGNYGAVCAALHGLRQFSDPPSRHRHCFPPRRRAKIASC